MSSKQLRFLALGDSYTIGENVLADHRWPNQLTKLLSSGGIMVSDPTIIAETGWTTQDLIEALHKRILEENFDVVSLLIGVNNQFQGLGLDDYRRDFRILMQQAVIHARGNPNRVIVLSIPDWGKTPFAGDRNREMIRQEIDAFNKINRFEAGLSGSHYIDVTAVSRRALSDSSLLASDRLHPSGKMYAEWVSLVLPVVIQILHKNQGNYDPIL
jgi:lysophospholipase L1-like esterase